MSNPIDTRTHAQRDAWNDYAAMLAREYRKEEAARDWMPARLSPAFFVGMETANYATYRELYERKHGGCIA